MKTRHLSIPVILIVIAILFQSNTSINNVADKELNIPEDVKVVLDNKCFGCHNVEGKSDKAKDKLLLDKMDELSKAKLVAVLGDINEVMVENKMPPEKFLEKKPEAKLTDDEIKLLLEWSDKAADELMN
jgi:hypothetical protein